MKWHSKKHQGKVLRHWAKSVSGFNCEVKPETEPQGRTESSWEEFPDAAVNQVRSTAREETPSSSKDTGQIQSFQDQLKGTKRSKSRAKTLVG